LPMLSVKSSCFSKPSTYSKSYPYKFNISNDKRCFSSSTSGFLSGKSAVVTGSTSGIGLQIAKSLASQGASVVLNGFGDPKQIEQITKEISSSSKTKIGYHPANLAKSSEIKDLIDYSNKFLGKVDILVNNAGIQHVSPVEQFPPEKWDDILSINLTAVFHTTRMTIAAMKQRKWGRIINIASVHGLVGSTDKSAYVAAKHGLVGFTKVVGLEAAGTGVTANCINPGWVRTVLVERQIEAKAKQHNISVAEAAEKLLAEKQPSKQFVQVEDLAQTVLFLCGEHAAQMTGTCLVMDGGWVAQ